MTPNNPYTTIDPKSVEVTKMLLESLTIPLRSHMCDSNQGSLCPSLMSIHQCTWIPGLSTLTHWAWVSSLDTISHALTPSMWNLPHECETSRQGCKISHIKENITFFFFACHFFLKLKPIHNLTEQTQKRLQNIKILSFFCSCFSSSRQAILISWQPWWIQWSSLQNWPHTKCTYIMTLHTYADRMSNHSLFLN